MKITTLKQILEIIEQGFEIRVFDDPLNDLFTPSIVIEMSDMNTSPVNHHRQVIHNIEVMDVDNLEDYLVSILQRMTMTLKANKAVMETSEDV